MISPNIGKLQMAKIKYVLVGFGGIAENRVAKEGFAHDDASDGEH